MNTTSQSLICLSVIACLHLRPLFLLQYLLHYLKSLRDWLGLKSGEAQLCKMAWSLLNDCYHTKLCITSKADHLAVTVCYIAMESLAIKVPLEDRAEKTWWQVRALGYSFYVRNICNLPRAFSTLYVFIHVQWICLVQPVNTQIPITMMEILKRSIFHIHIFY